MLGRGAEVLIAGQSAATSSVSKIGCLGNEAQAALEVSYALGHDRGSRLISGPHLTTCGELGVPLTPIVKRAMRLALKEYRRR